MNKLPKPGDNVAWATPQGDIEGRVEKIVTRPIMVKNHKAKASKDHPEVLVKSDASGKTAVHRPQALKSV